MIQRGVYDTTDFPYRQSLFFPDLRGLFSQEGIESIFPAQEGSYIQIVFLHAKLHFQVCHFILSSSIDTFFTGIDNKKTEGFSVVFSHFPIYFGFFLHFLSLPSFHII